MEDKLKNLISVSKITSTLEKFERLCVLTQKQSDRVETSLYQNTKLEVLSFQAMHQTKLAYLKTKVSNGKRVKVIFINALSGQFGFDSVYKAMERNCFFDPYILVISPWDLNFKKNPSLYTEAYDNYLLFLKRGYKTIFGYDKNGIPIDLDLLSPDIIFYNNPNLFHETNHFKNVKLNMHYLTCYVTYSMNVLGEFNYHYNNYFINTAWINFSETRYSYYQNINFSKYQGYNAVLSGYPKLDVYNDPLNMNNIPAKIQNQKPTIIYAPHWSINNTGFNLNISTFHYYYSYFLDLATNNPNYNFIFKPHPLLAGRIKSLENANNSCGISSKEYAEYLNKWNSLPNAVYINDGEYIDLFKYSSCLITDCGSFISEYLPSNKPCIYLFNHLKADKYAGINDFGKKILGCYTCCSSLDEIKSAVEQVVFNKKDIHLLSRKEILETEFVNLGTSGKFIVDYLETILRS